MDLNLNEGQKTALAKLVARELFNCVFDNSFDVYHINPGTTFSEWVAMLVALQPSKEQRWEIFNKMVNGKRIDMAVEDYISGILYLIDNNGSDHWCRKMEDGRLRDVTSHKDV